MNCEQLRQQLTGEPGRHRETFNQHAADCQPCRAFVARFDRCEGLLQQALNVDPAMLRDARPAVRPGSGMQRGRRAISLVAGLAVAAIAGLSSLVAPSGSGADTAEIAAAVIEHWDHEPESWLVTDASVSAGRLSEVLSGVASLQLADGRTVSFARICRVGNVMATHLVVQGDEGPYMVVLLPGSSLQSPVPLEAGQFNLAGHLLPAGSGSIAVLGAESDELSLIESELTVAVSWES